MRLKSKYYHIKILKLWDLKKSKLWQSHYYEIKSYLWHIKGKLWDKNLNSEKKGQNDDIKNMKLDKSKLWYTKS